MASEVSRKIEFFIEQCSRSGARELPEVTNQMRLIVIPAVDRGFDPVRVCAFQALKYLLKSLHAAKEFWRDSYRMSESSLELARA
jgi:hypothetical protein